MANKLGPYVKLRDVVELSPSTPKMSEETDVTFLGMADVSEDGRLLKNNAKKYKEVCRGFTSFQDNDVLVAKITPCFENGKGALIKDTINGIGFGSTEFHVLRPSNRIDTYYLLSITQSHPFRKLGESEMTGSAGQKRVPADFIRDYKVFLPPLAEQRKIAAILRTWDDAIGKYDLLIKKCEGRRDAIAIRIYGEIQRQASLSPMNEVCEFIRNGIVYQPAAEGDRKFQVTRIETISFGIIDFARTGFAKEGTKNIDRYKLGAGDILFSHINSIDHIGKTAIFEAGDLYHGMNLLCFRANRSIVHPRYLYNFLMLRSVRNYFMRKARPAVAQVSLNISDINECQIPVPSLDVQNDIVAKLGCYDLEISFLKKSRELTIQQKRGLMQKLLTGEWRVNVSGDAEAA